jgi:hypothetical protein
VLKCVLCWTALGTAGAGAFAALLPPLTFRQGQLWGAAAGWLVLSVVVSGFWASLSLFRRRKGDLPIAVSVGIFLLVQAREMSGVLGDRVLERAHSRIPEGAVPFGTVTWERSADDLSEVTIAPPDAPQGSQGTSWRNRALAVRIRGSIEETPLSNFGDDTSAAFFTAVRVGVVPLRIGALDLDAAPDQETFTANRLTARRLATQMRQEEGPALVVGRIGTTASAFECRILSELPQFSYFSGRGLFARILDLPFGRCLTDGTVMARGLTVVRDPKNSRRLLLYIQEGRSGEARDDPRSS